MNKEIQLEGSHSLSSIKPEVSKDGIFFPISVTHVDLAQYGGDGRSFGYHFDEGHCTVIKLERVVGALAEDTIALFDECAEAKRNMHKPHHDMLDSSGDKTKCTLSEAKLLIKYGSEYFYKDERGYFFSSKYHCYGECIRVTNESAEIYREVNKEYQRQIVNYNSKMKEALHNIKLLSETVGV